MLTDETIVAYWNKHQDPRALGRFVEAEVRKQDEALIRQLHGVLQLALVEVVATGMAEGVYFGDDPEIEEALLTAIAAAFARLKKESP